MGQTQSPNHPQNDIVLTGVPNLDQILDGGLPRGALVIIAGPPGSGKTTLANQIAFAAATKDHRALIFSALSEPTSKLIEHLRRYTFFKNEMVGGEIQFLSLEQFISADLGQASQAIITSAHKAKAGFIVLDGFRGVRGANVDPQMARQFLYDVGTTLSLRGTTTVITSEAEPRDPAFYPEATTADVIIGMHYKLVGIRQRRGIEAVKVRSAFPLSGLHGVGLDETGLTVYPRLETQVLLRTPTFVEYGGDVAETASFVPSPPHAGMPFALPELDGLLQGGIAPTTNAFLIGPPNTGKTLLGLRFALVGAEAAEPTVFLSFHETLAQLQQKTAEFAQFAGLATELKSTGHLRFQRWEPVELEADRVVYQLLTTIDQIHARRLIIDNVAELRRAVVESSGAEREPNFMAALLAALRLRGVTSLFVGETTADPVAWEADPLVVQTDTVLQLSQTASAALFLRTIRVAKARFMRSEPEEREMLIAAPEGIHIRTREG